MFLYAVGGSFVGQMLVIYFPPLQVVFQTEPLLLSDIGFLFVLCSSVLVFDEIWKAVLRWNERKGRTKNQPYNDV